MPTLKQVINTTPALAGKTYEEIAEWLNTAPMVANPVAVAPNVPRAIMLKRVMQIVPAGEMAKAYQLAGFVSDVKIAIEANDREYMTVLIGIAVAAGAISQATAGALATELQGVEPDPAWQPTIPGPRRLPAAGLAGPVTAADVLGAVHG